MKTLIICYSYHHKNTEKIASVFAKTLDAEVKTPLEVDPNGLSDYDLVGFGSGISFGNHYKELLDLVDKLPACNSKESLYFFHQRSNKQSDLNSTGNSEKHFNQKASTLLGSLIVQDLTLMGLSKFLAAYKKGIPTKMI